MSKVTLRLLRVGACRHLACMVARGGPWSLVDFPALCGLIHHTSLGWMLYDTGYASHFFDATRSLPERLYRTVLPVDLPDAECLGTQLAASGLHPEDVRQVVLSHFHGDHVAGLRDLPNARILALKADVEQSRLLGRQRWRATLNGQLPSLLPDDFADRLTLVDGAPQRELPAWMHPLRQGFDLCGDGSILGVPLPGHSAGQLGLFLPDVDGRPVLLAGDSCWSLPALQAGNLPAMVTQWISHDPQRYRQTFQVLHTLARREPALRILPSHCAEAWGAYCHES